jgi:hypothetical protein
MPKLCEVIGGEGRGAKIKIYFQGTNYMSEMRPCSATDRQIGSD